MKKLILLLGCLLYSGTAAAADEIINRNMQEAFAQTQEEIQKSVAEMDASMQKVMPEIARSMSETINSIFASFTPLLSSMEENKVFSKASARMNQDLKSSLNNIEQEVGTSAAQPSAISSEPLVKPLPKTQVKQNFLLTGSKSEDGKSLDFIISQNADAINETAALLDKKTAPSAAVPEVRIKDFNNHSLPLAEFKVENIGGQNFLIYDNQNIGTFALGNYNNRINVKIQTTGIDAYARTQSFLRNLKQNYLK